MKTYARISAGMIAELLTTDRDIRTLYHPSIQWVEVSNSAKIGWIQQGGGFEPSPPVAATLRQSTPAQLQAQVSALALQIAALQEHN